MEIDLPRAVHVQYHSLDGDEQHGLEERWDSESQLSIHRESFVRW